MEETALADGWDETVAWWESTNPPLVATPLAIFKCPSSPSPPTYEFEAVGRPSLYATGDYRGCQGANASDPSVAHWNKSGWIWGVVSRKYVSAAQITDGLSQTILLVESVGGRTIYGPKTGATYPKEIWYPTDGAWVGRLFSSVSPIKYGERMKMSQCGVNCANLYDYGPYSFHTGVAQTVLCDGAVRMLAEDIDPAVLCGLYTYHDEQVIGTY
jgi:hypothetical protein